MKSIIDVSSVIYAGHNGNDRRLHGFPIGGVRKLFGIINAGLSYSDFALCFDGDKIIKKELLPTYKAGRVPDYSVIAQIDLLRELLVECGIDFYGDDKHEADDYVYSVCAELQTLGEADDIEIYSDDRDLSCCVTDNISIKNVSTNGMCINRNNFSDRVVRGKTIPYNSILFWKIFHGDTSDNYKALHIPGLSFETVTQKFIEEVEPLIGEGGFSELAYADYDVFLAFSEIYDSVLSEGDMKRFKEQARIAYPYRVPVSDCDIEIYRAEFSKGDPLYQLERRHMKFFGNGSFNRQKFDFYCAMLGLNKNKLSLNFDKDSAEAQDFLSMLELRAKDLSNGTLAVKYSRSKRTVVPQEPTLSNMSLPD